MVELLVTGQRQQKLAMNLSSKNSNPCQTQQPEQTKQSD
jgi:hypothetical protein